MFSYFSQQSSQSTLADKGDNAVLEEAKGYWLGSELQIVRRREKMLAQSQRKLKHQIFGPDFGKSAWLRCYYPIKRSGIDLSD
jgi:hypothetical protein